MTYERNQVFAPMERTTSLHTEPSQTFAIGWKSNNYKSYMYTRIYNGELKQPPQRQQQERHKFAYLTTKTIVLHALHMHSVFRISLMLHMITNEHMMTNVQFRLVISKALVPIFF